MVKITQGPDVVVDTDTDDVDTTETEPDTTDTEPEIEPDAGIIASAQHVASALDTEPEGMAPQSHIEPVTPSNRDNQSAAELITLLAQVTEQNQELRLALERKEKSEYDSTVWCAEQAERLTETLRSTNKGLATRERLAQEELEQSREQFRQSQQTIAELQTRMSEQAQVTETLRLTNEGLVIRERLVQAELEQSREQFRQSQQTIAELQTRISEQAQVTETLRLNNERLATLEGLARAELLQSRDQNKLCREDSRLLGQRILALQERVTALEQRSSRMEVQEPPVSVVIQPIENVQAQQTLAALQQRIAFTNQLRRG